MRYLLKKIDNLENGLRREITAAANAAESALALTRDNKSTIENLQMEIISMKQDQKQEINLLKQEYSSQQMKIESVKTDNIELKCDAIRFQTNSIETYSRRDNLLFYGIRQPINESNFSCTKSAREFLVNQLQMTEEEAFSVQFVRCHRLNEHNKRSEIKPITARFNPIRSGLFRQLTIRGGLKSPPPPTISKTISSIFTISYM